VLHFRTNKSKIDVVFDGSLPVAIVVAVVSARLLLHVLELLRPPLVGTLAPLTERVPFRGRRWAKVLLLDKVRLHLDNFVVPAHHHEVDNGVGVVRTACIEHVARVDAGWGRGHEGRDVRHDFFVFCGMFVRWLRG